ncbi:HD domain-containing protein [Nocardia stercoris]|uniref:Metal-dependent phosphohydrolase n=1 Tax=Nocardia stercoris TaxID=2483361 RepID=A0A3M2LDX0_9NOCA|nr:metal-dependent phosphohydrolase [Nocardia stercoris]RMI35662.1 metal-dependent phosphohydrolase [Nocardia stercoris]
MTPTDDELLDRWVAVAGERNRCAGTDLVTRYREPHRRYHTVDHLTAMLRAIDRLAADADDVTAVVLAAFFHDAIYVIGAPDNEDRSAELAESVLTAAEFDPATVAEVVRLVRLTAAHAPEPGDRNGAVLCDVDLAVLGGSAADYAAYTAAVRAEYATVPDDLFRGGRAAVLQSLLDLPRLFHAEIARAAYEVAARANLSTELRELRSARPA